MTDSISLPPPSGSVDISVVVCAYTERRWDDLIVAIRSLQRQTLPPCQIILVIDHNPALQEKSQREFPGITIIENAQPRGLSGARNSGIAAAHGDIIAFMDEDAEATPDWLEHLSPHYADEHVMGVGGSITPLWLSGKPGWFPDEFSWVVGCTYKGMPEQPAFIRNLIGCNMSLRRNVFGIVGGFRTGRVGTLSIGLENDDTEMCIRALQVLPDRRFLYDPAARVINHRVPATRRSFRYFATRCFSEGISKARLSKKVGSQQGLSNERTYVARTLPAGVAHGIACALRGDLSGLGRAFAIVAGLSITVAGFLVGKLPIASTNERQATIGATV